jgi:glycosyl transferase family 87
MKSRVWLSLFSAQFLFTVIALLALNQGVIRGHGFYSRTAAMEAALALVAALVACLFCSDASQIPHSPQETENGTLSRAHRRRFLIPMAAAALYLSGKAFLLTRHQSEASLVGLMILRLSAGAGFVLIGMFTIFDLIRPGRLTTGFRVRLFLLFAAGALLRVTAVVIWPEPSIDVFVWLREAPSVLLTGHNPYVPENMSQGALAVYPPLPIVLAAPFTALGLDVRYANVICDIAAAWLLYAMARRRGQPVLGALIAGTYLNLPSVPFMLKNAWFEPMLAVLLAGGIWLADRGNRLGNVLLGLGLTGKQFGLPLLFPLWRACRGRRKFLLAGVGLAITLVIIPFLLWSPASFLNAVLYQHLAIAPDFDSLTLRSAAHHLFGVTVPGWLAGGLAFLLIGCVAWRTPVKVGAAGLWMGTTLLIFALLYIKGYFNYFYLCSYLFMLGLTAIPPEGPPAAPNQSHLTMGGEDGGKE